MELDSPSAVFKAVDNRCQQHMGAHSNNDVPETFMRHFFVLILLFGFILSGSHLSSSTAVATPVNQTADSSGPLDSISSLSDSFDADKFEDKLELESGFSAKKIASANSWAQTMQIADWLGPLAPVALSPFFGMACLSGLALYGPETLTNNALLGSTGPLRSELLFFVFIGLTLLTSLPRLSKVSKPFAQAMDQLETYSVIIILLAIKFLSGIEAGSEAGTQVAMVQLGVLSFTVDTLLMIAMAINIVVVNGVKFFFEFLVWLTPIPTVDAIFEVCNKALCGALMAVYAFSPTIATIINIVILLVALVVFRWMSRRVRFYRTMVMDPVLSRVWPGYGRPKEDALIVFPKNAIGPFKPKSRLKLTRDGDSWKLNEANWWMPSRTHAITASDAPVIKRGWVMHALNVTDGDGQHAFSFSRRYDRSLDDLANRLGLSDAGESSAEQSHQQAAFEFA